MLTEFKNELSRMHGLMSRMDKHYTAREAKYIMETKAPQQEVKPVLNENMDEEFNYTGQRIKTKDGKILDKFYIDPLTSTESTIRVKDEIKANGGKFDGNLKTWYWWIPAEGPEREAKKKQILDFVEKLTSMETPVDAENPRQPADVRAKVEELINQIDQVINTRIEGGGIDMQNFNEADLKNKLKDFKMQLLTITTSAEFKDLFEPMIRRVASGGYQYSLMNTLLIMLQDREATIVLAEGKWNKRNRIVTDKSHPIALWYPVRGKSGYGEEGGNKQKRSEVIKQFLQEKGKKMIKYLTPEEKEELDERLNALDPRKWRITQNFLIEKGKSSVKELTPDEKDELKRRIEANRPVQSFKLMPVYYDIRFTEVAEGKEDMMNTQEVMTNKPNGEVVWYDDKSPVTEESERLYNAIIATIKTSGVKIEYTNSLGGARGVSKSGTIAILTNASHNIGTVQDLVHEFAHELLHQLYLSGQKDNEFSGFFVGKGDGRSVIEQQAELTAWIVLRAFGYDAKTSINYIANWGLNESNAEKIFDTIANAASKIIKGMYTNMTANADQTDTQDANVEAPENDGQYINEDMDMNASEDGTMITGQEVADLVGMGDLYQRSEEYNEQQGADNGYAFNGTLNELASLIRESVRRKLMNEMATVKGGQYNDRELNFTHFAVNKSTGLIVNGWDYSDYDSEDLRSDKRYYFGNDLRDNNFDPREYKILTFNGCMKQGIDPNELSCWSNDGVTPCGKQ